MRQEEGVFEEGILLDGILETSASPVNYLKGKLLVFTNRAIKKSVLNKINSMYDPRKFGYTSSSDVENILMMHGRVISLIRLIFIMLVMEMQIISEGINTEYCMISGITIVPFLGVITPNI